MDDSLRGSLLIAAPSLFDFFRRTVVLIIEHAEEGAFGVVLNRPSDTEVREAVPALGRLTEGGELMRVGGPVSPETVVAIAEFEDPSESAKLILGDLGLVDPEVEEPDLRRLRVYAGHAGWGPGQLEDELERDAWIVEPASVEDPFREEDLWPELLNRKGGQYALLATMPDDPSLN
jgi:putative transcriptional regulator